MYFAPPSKVPRTQRQTLVTSTPPSVYRRTTELSSGLPEAPPTSIEAAVFVDPLTFVEMPAARYLSGAGTHMCWVVDENQKLLRLWDVSRPGWERAAPRLAEIPYFAAAEDGLPLFVSEMSGAEESLAFCSERGAISSLDHSIEVQMLDGDAAVTASSFVCARRLVGTESVIVTVLGTTCGLLVVDVKYEGTHTTTEFDRRKPSSFHWASHSHNNLHAQNATSALLDAEEGEDDRKANEEVSPSELLARQNDPNTSGLSSSLWRSLKSFIARSDDGAAAARAKEARRSTAAAARDGRASAEAVVPWDDGVWPMSPLGRARRGDGAFAFTHLQFRYHYPEQVVAVNAANEIFLLDFGPLPPERDAGARGTSPGRVQIKWATSLTASLRRAGHVVAVTETRHKMCLVYFVAATATHPLPELWLVTVEASLGKVVNFVMLNAVADVVNTAARIPSHHIKIFADDTRREVIVSIGAYVIRVNNQVGVRQPCSSEDTVHVKNLDSPIASLLLEGGSLVTLDSNGPRLTVTDVYAARMPQTSNSNGNGTSSNSNAAGRRSGYDMDGSGAADVKRLLDAVRADPKLSLDSAVLDASEALYSPDGPLSTSSSSGAGGAGSGNWARRNLNQEDDNIVQRVTRQLTARQQAHRRFLMAVLRDEAVRSQLAPETVAQLLSAQEALVSLCALRSLQNVGLQRSGAAGGDALLTQVLPPFTAMLDAVQRGGLHLLQRRPSRHTDGESSSQQQPSLLKNAQQLERCQQVLRRAIVSVADAIRAEAQQDQQHRTGSAASLTAAEICFSTPANLVRVLKAVGNYMMEVRNTVSLSLEEKYAECYAVGCVFIVVAQTIVESREDVGTVYDVPKCVQAQLWTSSTDPVTGVELCFSQSCRELSNMLADICLGLSASGDAAAAGLVKLTEQHKCDLLDIVVYLLYFSLTNSTHHDSDFVASAITSTILREPFVSGPVGYPHGSPAPSSSCAEVGRRILRLSEQLALRFDAMPILMAFALATPVDEPTAKPALYACLQSYCQQNTRVLDAAMQTLWKQEREWELLSLPAVLPDCHDVRARRNAFLEAQAPHLLWLADPERYDALNAEGQRCPPYIRYGDNQLSHRSRCTAMSRLAWVAAGAPSSSRFSDVELSEAIVLAQQKFLSPACDSVNLGPQSAVQRLLELKGNVAAWVQAAVIASHTQQPTSDDLLVQVLRHCRECDGEALRDIHTSSVSERETDARLRQTAVGQAIMACARLHDREALGRVCETLLSKDEFTLLSSWLAYLWSTNHESV